MYILIIMSNNILDPFSTIIKLAVLGKKEVGCKILIKNNQIFIQESGLFQGIARYYHGVTKNDIHYLSIPIDIACKRYLTIEKINNNPDIIIIFKCAQDGLNKLMETYATFPIVVHCLKYYYTIIDSYLQSIICKKTETEVIYKKIKPKNNSEGLQTPNLNLEYLNQTADETIENKNQNINDLLVLYTDELLNKFDLIWDKSKIKIIIDMIKYLLEEKSAVEYAAYIETFMIPIDKEIIKLV